MLSKVPPLMLATVLPSYTLGAAVTSVNVMFRWLMTKLGCALRVVLKALALTSV